LLASACATPSASTMPAPPALAFNQQPVSQAPSAAPAASGAGSAFSIAPYLWAAGIDGDVRAGRAASTPVNADFGDILENLEAGLMIAGEAWFSPEWGVLGDLAWMDLATDATGPLGAASVRATNELWHGQVSAAWRPARQNGAVVDVLGGVRWIDVESGLQTNVVSASVGEAFLDPVVGLRATVPIGSNFQLMTQADVGGFGVGTDLSYQLVAVFGWQFSQHAGIGLGWRHLAMDFDEEDLAMDVAFTGPLLGMRISF
jgi:hypothetical protein